MLIENNELNVEEFKAFFNNITWYRVPRKLNNDHSEYYYIGSYEDDNIIVKASVRPSLRMQIFETFKNRTLDGEIPPPDYKGRLCEWGASTTVQLTESVLNKILSVCQDLPVKKTQTMTW